MTRTAFKLEFTMDNAAFNDNGSEHEIEHILTKVIATVKAGVYAGIIRDTNGNTIGEWEAVDDGEPEHEDDEDLNEYETDGDY